MKQRALSIMAGWLFCLGMLSWSTAYAHPHMWIDAKINLRFDIDGHLVAIDQTWIFDEMFSSYAKQGMPLDVNQLPPKAELDKIAADWMTALADPMSHYFTTVVQAGEVLPLAVARDGQVRWNAQTDRLSLHFELPLSQPVSADKFPITVSVADPTYFVAYSFDSADAVMATGAPAHCQPIYRAPSALDPVMAQRLAAIPASVQDLPPDLLAITQTLQHRIELSCR